MNTLKIPLVESLNVESSFDKINALVDKGLLLSIDKVNWPNDFPKILPVTVNLAHDNSGVYLYYRVQTEELRVINTKDFMPVWEDSCVEFFMQHESEKTSYRNFEFNAHGVLLASVHQSREESEKMSIDVMSSIIRFTTIAHTYENDKQLSNWTLLAEIPKDAMGFSIDESLSKQRIRANFYKCGDKTSEPHFLSWKSIETEAPNFHVPQFFGELEFE